MLIDVERFLYDTFHEVTITATRFRVLCPLHGSDNQPSLSFGYDGLWYCHTCKRGGNTLWDFVVVWNNAVDSYEWQAYKGIEYLCTIESAQLEAISRLYPYTVPEDDTLDTNTVEQYDRQVLEAEKTARYQREVAEIEKYVEGEYLPPGLHATWDGDINAAMAYMFSRGFSADILEKELVYTWDKTAKTSYPLLFILFYQGKILGYQARGIRDGMKQRYLTMSGLTKQQWIFGRVPEGKHVILLTEGLTDRIKAIQYGYHATFSTLGSTFSEAQADLLERHASHVICAYHDDEPGRKGLHSVESKMNIREIRTVPLRLPVKDICIAGEVLFRKSMDEAFEKLGLGEDHVMG